MKSLIVSLAVLFLSQANAAILKLECSDGGSHTLKISIDEKILTSTMTAPGSMTVEFELDGKLIKWKSAHYMSAIVEDQYATYFQNSGANQDDLYITSSKDLSDIGAGYESQSDDIEFSCKKK